MQPLEIEPGVRTVGELEVIEHIAASRPLIDTRPADAYAESTIPTAVNLPHEEIGSRIDELDPSQPAVLFCNGPLCSATPDAIRTLLEAGHPRAAVRYYRGGLHVWITVGLPVEGRAVAPAPEP